MPNSSTVGALYGKVLWTFNTSGDDIGEDTGPLSYLETPPWYKGRTFQLVGSGTGFTITIYGTLDGNTADDINGGAAWDPIPAPSTESTPAWSNPMTDVAGTRLFFCNAPFAAVRAVSTSPGSNMTGTLALVMLAAA